MEALLDAFFPHRLQRAKKHQNTVEEQTEVSRNQNTIWNDIREGNVQNVMVSNEYRSVFQVIFFDHSNPFV